MILHFCSVIVSLIPLKVCVQKYVLPYSSSNTSLSLLLDVKFTKVVSNATAPSSPVSAANFCLHIKSS